MREKPSPPVEIFFDIPQYRVAFEARLNAFSKEAKLQIMDAFDLAVVCHEGQMRDEGVPVITHLVGAAAYAIDFGERDADRISIYLLHDSLEDSDYIAKRKRPRASRIRTARKFLTKRFNKKVADGVIFSTKFESKDVNGKTKGARKSNATKKTHAEYEKGEKEMQVLKVPDRYHNVVTILAIGKNRAGRTLDETEKFYMPIWNEITKNDPVYGRMVESMKVEIKKARKALVSGE